MKKLFSTILIVVAVIFTIQAQAPGSFKYQAVLHDARGNVRSNSQISVKIEILSGSENGPAVFSETQKVTSDANGIININVGAATSGSAMFTISWNSGTYFLKVTADEKELGTNQLLSVPYALFAYKTGYEFNGNYADLRNKPALFYGSWSKLEGKPSLSKVATSGSYKDLRNTPAKTSGTVTGISGTEPVTVASGSSTPVISMVPSSASTSGYVTSSDWTMFKNRSNFDGTWMSLTGKPVLSAVASTGDYNDLTNRPVGKNNGDMQYWTGSEWGIIPSGQPGNRLRISESGLPSWMEVLNLVVITSPVSSITQTSASSGGNVASDGGTPITARGICWSTTANPSIANNKTTDGTGTGAFVSAISGLTANTIYYIRAYATNSKGTSYGNQQTFTTLTLPPTNGLIGYWPFNGNANDESGNGNNGIVNGASLTPDRIGNLNSAYIFNGVNNWIKMPSGSNTTINITGNFSLAFWFKTSQNHAGIIGFGDNYSYNGGLLAALGNGSIVDPKMTVMTGTTWYAGNTFLSDNSWHFACINLNENLLTIIIDNKIEATYSNAVAPLSFNGLRAIGSRNDGSSGFFNGLIDDIRIYNRALTVSEIQSIFVETIQTGNSIPTITTDPLTAITLTTATSGGNVTSDGGTPITSRGVCWSTTANPTILNSKTTDGTGTGTFTSSLTGLTANTTYYLRAYATNSKGTAYGNIIQFTTLTQSYGLYTIKVGTDELYFVDFNTKNLTKVANLGMVCDGFTELDYYNGKLYIEKGGYVYTLDMNTGVITQVFTNPDIGLGITLNNAGEFYTLHELTGTPEGSLFRIDLSTNVSTKIGTTTGSMSILGIDFDNNGQLWAVDEFTQKFGKLSTSTGRITFVSPAFAYTDMLYLSADDKGYLYTYSVGIPKGIVRYDIANNSQSLFLSTTDSYAGLEYAPFASIPTVHTIPSSVMDVDGNVYNTVTIGSQVWMTQNLKTTRYRNGDLIGTTTPANLDITGESTPKYQWPSGGNENNVATYGRFYTWYTATDSRNVCPTGWHVPSDNEWAILSSFVGGNSIAGGKLKEAGTTHWQTPNTGATNEVGFTALPGGIRISSGSLFNYLGGDGFWWSSTESNTQGAWLRYSASDFSNINFTWKSNGLSIRCLQGEVAVMPTLTTDNLTLITQTSAVSGGNITNDGEAQVTARGVCWSTSANPTISNSKTNDGPGKGTFTSSITGLTGGTVYHIRSYATNSAGTAYGDEKIFSTISYSVPVVITGSTLSITQTTATSGGNITSDGGQSVIARGVCWNTSPNPTTDNSKTIDGGGTGSYTSSITGLTASTTYYIRAYAINNAGTAYGNEVSFTTASAVPGLSGNVASKTDILCFGAATGSITVSGTGGLTPYEYRLDGGAYQLSGTFGGLSAGPHLLTVRDAALSTFDVNVTITQPAAALSVTTVVVNLACFGGATGSATANPAGGTGPCTLSWNTTPVQTTATATGLSAGTYSVVVTDANSCSSTANVTITQPATSVSGSITSQTNVLTFGGNNGSVTVSGSGGTPPYQYKLGSGVYQSSGTFGTLIAGNYMVTIQDANLCTFNIPVIITQPLQVLATVTTTSASSITSTTASSGGNVTSDGGAAVTARGVCWSTSANPTIANSKTTNGSGTGSFTSSITGLSIGTTYYARAYATNSVGTAYGNEISFTTGQLSIGDSYGGGIVFYLDGSGQSGLVCAPTDQGTGAEWGCYGTEISGADGISVGTGNQNTIDIINSCVTPGIAASICSDLSLNGYDDWYLPSKDELALIYNNLRVIGLGNFTIYYYWSSTEGNSTGAWIHGFQSNATTIWNKNSTAAYFRAIRSFSIATTSLPTITTTAASNITHTTATAGGNITNDGGAAVTSRGVCWSTTPSPTIINSKTNDGTGTGTYVSSITGLTAGTNYYVRAYATNSAGTAYGNEISFTAVPASTLLVGDPYQGGIIGYILESSDPGYIAGQTSGIIAAPSDQSTGSQWYGGPMMITGASGTAIGIGNANTNMIVTAQGAGSYAARLCYDLVLGGYSDWYLPSTMELWQLFHNRDIIGGFNSSAYYWSSSEFSSNEAYRVQFIGGTYMWANKINTYNVRAVRSFSTAPATLPTLSTAVIFNITSTTASSGGNITSDGGASVTSRGVCWSTSSNPTTAGSKTVDGTGTGTFTSSITGLTAGTTYYLRAYATNSFGTSYGNQVSFTTIFNATIGDIDGNVYNTVTIGTQVWMSENLKTTKYRNGELIGTTTPSTLDISGESTPKYQWAYDGIESNVTTYGRLYTWYAVTDSRNVCPTGWHVPSDPEWTTMENYLIANGYNYDGTTTGNKIAKSLAATTSWTTHTNEGAIGNNLAANNITGFSALPSGFRYYSGGFTGKGTNCYWVSSSAESSYTWDRSMYYHVSWVTANVRDRKEGKSVRCLKD